MAPSESPQHELSASEIFAIERPDSKLLKLYIIRNILAFFVAGPFVLISAPIAYFRYQTMRYKFDDEGISMRWGLLFRQEVNLTYARIQDIHLSSGVIQRWLGLADIQIQTASGSAAAEMTIEGLPQFQQVRDYLYSRMRGSKAPTAQAQTPQGDNAALIQALHGVQTELRATRQALEKLEQGQRKEQS